MLESVDVIEKFEKELFESLKNKNSVVSKIYFIQNIINGKLYIGRTITGKKHRFDQHIKKAYNENDPIYFCPLKIAIRN